MKMSKVKWESLSLLQNRGRKNEAINPHLKPQHCTNKEATANNQSAAATTEASVRIQPNQLPATSSTEISAPTASQTTSTPPNVLQQQQQQQLPDLLQPALTLSIGQH